MPNRKSLSTRSVRSFAAVAMTCVLLAAGSGKSGLAFQRLEPLDTALYKSLNEAGFTGRIESSLEARLGRPVDSEMADLGRLIFFDNIQDCTTIIPVRAAIRPSLHLAIRNRSQSASITITSSVRTGAGRETSAEHRR